MSFQNKKNSPSGFNVTNLIDSRSDSNFYQPNQLNISTIPTQND